MASQNRGHLMNSRVGMKSYEISDSSRSPSISLVFLFYYSTNYLYLILYYSSWWRVSQLHYLICLDLPYLPKSIFTAAAQFPCRPKRIIRGKNQTHLDKATKIFRPKVSLIDLAADLTEKIFSCLFIHLIYLINR